MNMSGYTVKAGMPLPPPKPRVASGLNQQETVALFEMAEQFVDIADIYLSEGIGAEDLADAIDIVREMLTELRKSDTIRKL